MNKKLIIVVYCGFLSAIGVGGSLSFNNIPLVFLFAALFIGNMIYFMNLCKEIEEKVWKEKRKIAKMLNDNEKEFQKIYKQLALKSDKFKPEKIQPGSRPSEAYERMVRDRDSRSEDKATQEKT